MASTCVSIGLPGAFVVTCGELAGRVIRFDGPGIPLTFGRAVECAVQFPVPSISRVHACAACIGDTYVVSDAGSRNGTYVNGRRIDTATALEHGDLVRLGTEIGLRFCLADAEEDTGLMQAAGVGVRDPLTGLPDRADVESLLEAEISTAVSQSNPLSVMMIEVDRFKELCDSLGRMACDEVLLRLARTISGAIRNTDVLARYGDHEFLVIAPCTPLEDAYWVAERIRCDVVGSPFAWKSNTVTLTSSLGVASLDCCGPQTDRLSLLFLAQQRAWLARTSRNCVVNRGGSIAALIPSDTGDATLVSPA